MINTEQLAIINGCVAGIHSSYSDKPTVDEQFLARYNKEGLRFTISHIQNERILSVINDARGWGFGFNKILEINLGYVVPETQPTGPQSGEGDEIIFKEALAA